MDSLDTRNVLGLVILAGLMAVGSRADVKVEVTYGARGDNSFAPDTNANTKTLVANQVLELGASKSVLLPCSIFPPGKEGLPIHFYVVTTADRPDHPDPKLAPLPCDPTPAPIPENATFLVVLTDEPSGLKPPGVRGAWMKINRPPSTAQVAQASKDPPTQSTPAAAGAATAAMPTWATALIALAFLLAVGSAGYSFWAAADARKQLTKITSHISKHSMPTDLPSRVLRLEGSSPVSNAQSYPDDRVSALAIRVAQIEAAIESQQPAMPPACAPPPPPPPLPPQDSKVPIMLERITALDAALTKWNSVTPDKTWSDLKQEEVDLRRLSSRIQQAGTVAKSDIAVWLRCSGAVATKILFSADTGVDKERRDYQTQKIVNDVMSAAGVELVEPPINSDPRAYEAIVLPNTIRAQAGDLHGAVAAVRRRGLKRGQDYVEPPHVCVFD